LPAGNRPKHFPSIAAARNRLWRRCFFLRNSLERRVGASERNFPGAVRLIVTTTTCPLSFFDFIGQEL
jgi:hypothetical protein